MNLIATVVERLLTAVTWLAMHVVIISERWRRPSWLPSLSGRIARDNVDLAGTDLVVADLCDLWRSATPRGPQP